MASVLAALLLLGCAPSSVDADLPSPTAESTTPPSSTSSPGKAPQPAKPGTALAAVATLAVKGRAPKTDYARDRFGPAWADTDRNGCDTRNDVLRRDLTSETVKADTHNCVVLRGILADPYTGQRITFVRGGASEVDIDHVVALSDAWQKGAAQWEPRKRLAFANDPLNLLAVEAAANRQKGDSDAATWLPPNKSYRCQYVARQVAVKAKYQAWVTAAERDTMRRILASCPSQALPSSTAPTIDPTAAPAAPAPVAGATRSQPCDPNYTGACVPIASDVDCAGRGGNGPAYVEGPVRVVGRDIYNLDGNGDAIGCES